MADPDAENFTNIEIVKEQFAKLKEDWEDLTADYHEAQDMQDQDLFNAIAYLRLNDQMAKTIYDDLKELDRYAASAKSEKNGKELVQEIERFKTTLQDQWQAIDDEYPDLADEVLGKAQDRVTSFANTIPTDELMPNARNDITQNLDKELFLQELRDILEGYRQDRESYISEVEMNSLRKLSEDKIPEDLGEENPEMDAILSQLDTLITTCDMALTKNEIEE